MIFSGVINNTMIFCIELFRQFLVCACFHDPFQASDKVSNCVPSLYFYVQAAGVPPFFQKLACSTFSSLSIRTEDILFYTYGSSTVVLKTRMGS